MEKRQVILLVALIAAVGYFLFDTFMAGDSGPAALNEQAVRAQVEKDLGAIQTKVEAKAPSDAELARAKLAQRPLEELPFYAANATFYFTDAQGEDVPENLTGFEYNGYLELDGTIFAIINGIEYTHGEELESTGYIVKAILRNYVVLETTSMDGSKTYEERIPFVEDDQEDVHVRVSQ